MCQGLDYRCRLTHRCVRPLSPPPSIMAPSCSCLHLVMKRGVCMLKPGIIVAMPFPPLMLVVLYSCRRCPTTFSVSFICICVLRFSIPSPLSHVLLETLHRLVRSCRPKQHAISTIVAVHSTASKPWPRFGETRARIHAGVESDSQSFPRLLQVWLGKLRNAEAATGGGRRHESVFGEYLYKKRKSSISPQPKGGAQRA